MISGNAPRVMAVDAANRDPAFQQDCLDLLRPYYSRPEIPLRYAFDHESTHVYSSRTADGILEAIFFARAPERILDDLPIIGYMGLTATLLPQKNRARPLWKLYLDRSRAEAGDGADLRVWCRTASPFALYVCHHLLKNGEPASDGSYSGVGVTMIRMLRQHYGLPPEAAGDHPFVARGYAGTRYSEFEHNRIAQYCSQHPSEIISQLAIR